MKRILLIGLMVMTMVLALSLIVTAGGDVEKGKALFYSPELGTNGKSCASCHPGGSRINGQKGSYTIMGHRLNSVEDAINLCIEMALKGNPLKKDSQEMKALSAYVKTLKGKKRKKRIIKGC
ncbi:MAG: hypothetical protein D6710_08790 [Nitrospirae bacterium]|nr:MAG: hypothetical protein D6710_08790 [Nitrospirota bacterium]